VFPVRHGLNVCIEFTRKLGLDWEVVKLTTVQVTRLPLQHEICKMRMICSAKLVLTKDLCVVQEQEFFNNILYPYVRKVHLTKGQAYS
jgi:hypothetical protein